MANPALWNAFRADYLRYLKQVLVMVNQAAADERHTPRFIADVYARLLRAKAMPSDADMLALAANCEDVLSYDVVEAEFTDGNWIRWQRSEIKAFISLFAISIRQCHAVFGSDFVRYVRKFNLAACYRPQGEREPNADYDAAWLDAWTRFIELADAYDEPLAAQRVLERLERWSAK